MPLLGINLRGDGEWVIWPGGPAKNFPSKVITGKVSLRRYLLQVEIRPKSWKTHNNKSNRGIKGTPEFSICRWHVRVCQKNNKKAHETGTDAENTEPKCCVQAKLFLPVESEGSQDWQWYDEYENIGGEVESPGDSPEGELTLGATEIKFETDAY